VDPAWRAIWSATNPSTETALMQANLQAWFAQASQYTPQQYYQGGFASPTVNPATLNATSGTLGWGTQLWESLPRFRFYGVDPNLTYQIANWAATIWTSGNWALNNSATCALTNYVYCTSDSSQ